MRRFIVTYRWELWLLLWAPLLSGLIGLGDTDTGCLLGDRGWMYPPYFFYTAGAVWSLMLAGLLLVFYGRARRLERGFLTLVWGYALGLAAIGALVWLAAAAFSRTMRAPDYSLGRYGRADGSWPMGLQRCCCCTGSPAGHRGSAWPRVLPLRCREGARADSDRGTGTDRACSRRSAGRGTPGSLPRCGVPGCLAAGQL